jgi:hypothetical protein
VHMRVGVKGTRHARPAGKAVGRPPDWLSAPSGPKRILRPIIALVIPGMVVPNAVRVPSSVPCVAVVQVVTRHRLCVDDRPGLLRDASECPEPQGASYALERHLKFR